eukprot:TRINITY_DN15917_c0_g1_i1.p1 TRINITY_DN15917_c0_g1~~TRINITY_DN15917_c0_g1_i1.p1  ORF type:complete len:386 (-),score=81.55 TRINITY_DN15917_c0_g1_i1:83-1240(-)
MPPMTVWQGLLFVALFLCVATDSEDRSWQGGTALAPAANFSSEDRPIPMLGVTAFLNVELLIRLLNSIDYPVKTVVIIHNGRHARVSALVSAIRQERPGWIIEAYPDNLGLAGSWNRMLELAPTAVYHVITNDDIVFLPGALRRLARAAEWYRRLLETGETNRVVLYPTHGPRMWKSTVWSCFVLLRKAIDVVGRFDPNLWPVYHEDYDYMVRMARAGLWQELMPDVVVQHGRDFGRYRSGTDLAGKRQPADPAVREYRRQQGRQERGSPYYALKWGRGERLGLYDEREGDWNRTCTGRGPHRRCVPAAPRLYSHPFNDSSLPLSFYRFDPQLRRCLLGGQAAPCRYNASLLPHPSRVPHDVYATPVRRWLRHGEGVGLWERMFW